MSNPMRSPRIEKITLNYGAGKDQSKLEKGMVLLEYISSANPVKTVTNKRIQDWGLRPGLPIGCKVTIRKQNAVKLLKSLLGAKDNRLRVAQFDNNGNIAFGIHEYIDIQGVKYNPTIGIEGFEVCITLERPGYRIKKRSTERKKIPSRHRVGKEEAIEFMKSQFNITVEGEEE